MTSDEYRYDGESMLLITHGMEHSSDKWKAPASHTLEIRHIDPRGPAFLGELIASGPCRLTIAPHAVDVDLAPYEPPAEPIPVVLYVSGKYAGVATLGPDGLTQSGSDVSPWMAITSFLT